MSQLSKNSAASLPSSVNSGPTAAKRSVQKRREVVSLIRRSQRSVQLVLMCALILLSHSAAADVVVAHEDEARSPTFLLISGTITKADIHVVSNALSRQKASTPEVMVFLDSGGGDLDAAIEIGRLIHRKVSVAGTTDKMSFVLGTTINAPAHRGSPVYCASACVLILSAAQERLGGPRIGIHRPYSVRLGADDQDWVRSAAYASVASKLKDYLREMAMPVELFDEMMRVPAERVRWLSDAEQAAFGLAAQRAVLKGSPASQMVAQLGAVTRHYLDQKALAAKPCPGGRPGSLTCLD